MRTIPNSLQILLWEKRVHTKTQGTRVERVLCEGWGAYANHQGHVMNYAAITPQHNNAP